MSFSMNRVTLAGNVGQDPEVRSMQNGSKVCNISLATNKTWKDRNGEKQQSTEWHRLVIFGDGLISSLIEPYVTKGTALFVEGELRTRKWTDQSGSDKYTTEIVVSGPGSLIKLMGGGNGNGGEKQHQRREAHTGDENGRYDGDDLDDEIPF